MDNNTINKIGIDTAGTSFLSARVETVESSKRIVSLRKLTRDDLLHMLNTENQPFIMSVPDNNVTGKYLSVDKDLQLSDKYIQFELKQSLLDESSDFCYDILPTSDNSRKLALIVRKAKLEELSNNVRTENGLTAESFQPRSVALGKGFLEFCRNETDRLICLADFSTDTVSLCFVLGEQILATASFDKSRFELISDESLSRITAELKTIINFKLNELAGRGLKISLSKLIVCGGKLTFNQKQTIASKLSVELEAPHFKDSMLNNLQLPLDSSWADYLVALGLTIE